MTTTETPSAPGQPRRAWREWAGRAAAVLGGLLAAWLLLEVLLRIAAPVLPPPMQILLRRVKTTPFSPLPESEPPLQRTDSTYGMIARQYKDNQYIFAYSDIALRVTTINWLDPNSHVGFRVPSPDWQPRWPVDAVIVGDSFTFCSTEYEDCWVQLLDTQYGMSVVNLGLSGTGTISHQRVLDTFGLPYEPRMVIWQWWGNDFNDDYGLTYSDVGVGDIAVIIDPTGGKRQKPDPVKTWLDQNSAVYYLASRLFFAREYNRPEAAHLYQPYEARDGSLSLRFGSTYVRDSFDIRIQKNQEGFELSKKAILEARDRLAEKDIPLVIVLLPAKEDVYRKWTEPKLGKDWVDELSAGRQKMLDFCREEGLLCVDASPALAEHANQGEQVYWYEDWHLDPAGNAILAGVVADFLKTNGLIQ